MLTATITLEIPENLYQRFVKTAKATKRPLEEIMLQVLKVGSPPVLDDIPEQYRGELTDLDQLEDQNLWEIATNKKVSKDLEIYDILLTKNKESLLTKKEQLELSKLRQESEIFMLRKAHAMALLHWRGYKVPNH
jgi:hypothetical protein